VCVWECVGIEALRLADPPSKESYRMCIGLWSTMLHARKSWVRFPMRSLDSSSDIILPAAVVGWSVGQSVSYVANNPKAFSVCLICVIQHNLKQQSSLRNIISRVYRALKTGLACYVMFPYRQFRTQVHLSLKAAAALARRKSVTI
jgi:hypothetical protein